MSSENKGEWPVGEAVDQVFNETFGTSRKGRMILAAYALSPHVFALSCLRDARDASHDDVPPAPPLYGISIFSPAFNVPYAPDYQVAPSVETSEEDEAVEALDAAIDNVRERFGLSARQAEKALKLAQNAFQLYLY